MSTSSHKQQVLTQLQAALKKLHPSEETVSKRPVLEEILYAICREGVTTATADKVFNRFRKGFYDWNEVRVSTMQEVGEYLHGLPNPGSRAKRIVGLLQEVFEEGYSFDLNEIAKKGLKQAAKQLARYKAGVNDFAVAWVTQRSFGGHAIPIDAPALRVFQRLGVIDVEAEDVEAIRSGIEHHIAKANGIEFTEGLSLFAQETCTEAKPKCVTCPMKNICPTGQEILAKAKSKAKPK